ncbi:MAG: DUF3748 domain-containing protein [Kiritimatiellia bacterium]
MKEIQLTSGNQGHILTNTGVWSRDSRWLVYDIRVRDDVFSGTRIERVNIGSKEVKLLYQTGKDACCGVVTCSPVEDKAVFIHGPENPTNDWQYSAFHRKGMVLDMNHPAKRVIADARNLTKPFTPGALRGGTHVHVFSGDGQWISFTYEDALLAENKIERNGRHINLRNVGVCVPNGPVKVNKAHPRNHDGEYFSVLVSKTSAKPKPGSDEISRAFSDAWVGNDGYVKTDGTHRKKAIAFQGHVCTTRGEIISEVFIADLPDDMTRAAPGLPLEGTVNTRPNPPAGVVQRRLTYTADRRYPGLQGPRHWLRSSPDGSKIAFLMKDDDGTVQLWTVSPEGGEPQQISSNPWDIQSAFSWSPDGKTIAHVMDNSIFVTGTATGRSRRITERTADINAPTSHSCVFSPDGKMIAYMRPDPTGGDGRCQLYTVNSHAP